MFSGYDLINFPGYGFFSLGGGLSNFHPDPFGKLIQIDLPPLI